MRSINNNKDDYSLIKFGIQQFLNTGVEVEVNYCHIDGAVGYAKGVIVDADNTHIQILSSDYKDEQYGVIFIRIGDIDNLSADMNTKLPKFIDLNKNNKEDKE